MMTGPGGREWGTKQHASAVRLAVLGIWLTIVASTPYEHYARFPAGMSAGFGLGRLLLSHDTLKSFFFSPPVLMALKWSAIVGCLLAILLPNRWRWLTPVVFLNIVVLDLLTKAINGFANHAQLGPLFVLLVFAVFSDRDYLPLIRFRDTADPVPPLDSSGRSSAGPLESRYAPVVWLAGLTLIIPYTYISLNRLLEGGLDLFLGNALLEYITLTSRHHSAYESTVFVGLIQIPLLAALLKAGYLVTTLFEVTSVGVLFSRAFRMIWLVVIGSFHFITLFSMNIFFWENLVLIGVLFGWGIWTRSPSPVEQGSLA
jgi:hypothetical protein